MKGTPDIRVMVTGSWSTSATVNHLSMICLQVHQDFDISPSLLLFGCGWLWKDTTDVQKWLAVTTQQVSLPICCATTGRPCKIGVHLICSRMLEFISRHSTCKVKVWTMVRNQYQFGLVMCCKQNERSACVGTNLWNKFIDNSIIAANDRCLLLFAQINLYAKGWVALYSSVTIIKMTSVANHGSICCFRVAGVESQTQWENANSIEKTPGHRDQTRHPRWGDRANDCTMMLHQGTSWYQNIEVRSNFLWSLSLIACENQK